jgi:hypothetical protein
MDPIYDEIIVTVDVLTAEKEYSELPHLYFDTSQHEKIELPKSDVQSGHSGSHHSGVYRAASFRR